MQKLGYCFGVNVLLPPLDKEDYLIDFVQSLPLSELQLASLILMCLLLVLVPICVVSMTMFNKEYFVNVYVSNKVDAVYKVTVNDIVIPPVATNTGFGELYSNF